jgi:hypothetical protein
LDNLSSEAVNAISVGPSLHARCETINYFKITHSCKGKTMTAGVPIHLPVNTTNLIVTIHETSFRSSSHILLLFDKHMLIGGQQHMDACPIKERVWGTLIWVNPSHTRGTLVWIVIQGCWPPLSNK